MRIIQSSGYIDDETKTGFDPNHHDPLEHPRPANYANLTLPPFWYSSVHHKDFEKKRKHRKQEGSISKTDLTTMISKSWRKIDPEVLAYCEKLHKLEKSTAAKREVASKNSEVAQSEESTPESSVVWPASMRRSKQGTCTAVPMEISSSNPVEGMPMDRAQKKTHVSSSLQSTLDELDDFGDFTFDDEGFRFDFSKGI